MLLTDLIICSLEKHVRGRIQLADICSKDLQAWDVEFLRCWSNILLVRKPLSKT